MMERETRREESERQRERKRRARRRGGSRDGGDRVEALAVDVAGVPAGVQTALLSTPHHRQVNYSGEAERRGWPSISLNVAEEWGSDEEDDI